MSYNQLISYPSTYVKKRAQRSDDSILLRHMDDVLGTGPDEHLMSDFEQMKTSLYLTDVFVLRHECDTVNFLGLEITKTSRGFRGEKQYGLRGIFFESLRVGKLETDTQSRKTLDSAGALATALPLDGHEYINFRTAFEKLIFMALWRPDMQLTIQQQSTLVLNPTTESKPAVKQLIRDLKGTNNTCLRLEPHMTVQTRTY